MSLKQFKDLPVDAVFLSDGIEYKKIPDEKISCCSIRNAAMTGDPTKKKHIIPNTEVEVND